MKQLVGFLALALLYAACAKPEAGGESSSALGSHMDSVSYSLGVNFASQIKQEGLTEINSALFAQAVQDAFAADSLLLNKEKAQQVLADFFRALKTQQLEQNLAQGREFLKQNAKRKGVKSMPSGVQYEVLQAGSEGPQPRATQNVKCHYTGMLTDSTVFESTLNNGLPTTFPVNGVIKGLSEALQQMTIGAKWKVYIPTELAYGDKPYPGGYIRPNMALIYEIELLAIEPN